MVKRIAIIPARGGSQRIPRKNIVDFEGKPMIVWSIEAAQKSGCFDRIFVSTDSEEIAQVAKNAGVEVPFLRESAHDSITPVSRATVHALEQIKACLGEQYEVVVQLMANCPLRGAEEIKQALEVFEREKRSFQLSCFRYGFMNPWWAHERAESGIPKALFPEALKTRSQDLPELYCPTGSIWVARTEALLKAGTFYGEGYAFEPLQWISGLDIDDEEDFRLARALKRMISES